MCVAVDYYHIFVLKWTKADVCIRSRPRFTLLNFVELCRPLSSRDVGPCRETSVETAHTHTKIYCMYGHTHTHMQTPTHAHNAKYARQEIHHDPSTEISRLPSLLPQPGHQYWAGEVNE